MTFAHTATRFARWSGVAALALAAPLALAGHAARAQGDAGYKRLPAPAVDQAAPAGLQTAVFAGGCFWGVQGVFEHVKGVRSAVSGYAGGHGATAHYEVVSTGLTGHAEAVKVTYDPRQVSYGRLLQVFFTEHDPTQVNRQFPDEGSQYRSQIYGTPEQVRMARAYVAQLQHDHAFSKPIVTRIDPMRPFYAAEAHHQDFLALNPDHPYIAAYDMPKVEALQRLYPDLYRAQPVRLAKAG